MRLLYFFVLFVLFVLFVSFVVLIFTRWALQLPGTSER